MTKTEIIKTFKNNILSIKDKKNENEIQSFLEENCDFIPTPYLRNHGLHFNFIFSKLAINEELISDFFYLTKSSIEWVGVLIELEASSKKIFRNNKKDIQFSAEFNNAYDQILSWKAYLQKNHETFKRKFKNIMGHMYDNQLSLKYYLIIGRSDEIDTQENLDP